MAETSFSMKPDFIEQIALTQVLADETDQFFVPPGETGTSKTDNDASQYFIKYYLGR